ncbi:hypothetical protein EXIGLDRAFT_724340 [Exidia glandulosa HHB12029]|uniref:C2H2-type domain-containing protein n=1 Tax=Exidia glandulosa HHB12029 TaxID=1314781 RepID=A0A165EGZ4_EXIGL|nr:hypothetical protein EXIGLDRAFT_724340 [Exidia glandulosa HHB12029]
MLSRWTLPFHILFPLAHSLPSHAGRMFPRDNEVDSETTFVDADSLEVQSVAQGQEFAQDEERRRHSSQDDESALPSDSDDGSVVPNSTDEGDAQPGAGAQDKHAPIPQSNSDLVKRDCTQVEEKPGFYTCNTCTRKKGCSEQYNRDGVLEHLRGDHATWVSAMQPTIIKRQDA